MHILKKYLPAGLKYISEFLNTSKSDMIGLIILRRNNSNNSFPTILLALCFLLTTISCKSKGPTTPEEALNAVREGYINSNGKAMELLLSEKSKSRIRISIKIISSMDDSQIKALSRAFNVDESRLKNLSVKDYLDIQMAQSRKMEEDELKAVTKYKITGTDIKDNRAAVRLENGMELSFVKEGYWKYEMTE